MADATRTAGLPPVLAGPRAATIIGAAKEGAWVDDWADVDGQPSEDLVDGLKIAAVAWAPLHAGGQLIGLLAVGGSASATDQRQRLPDLVDLASVIAGSSLGWSLRERASVSFSRDRIRKLLDEGAFRPVFQPIVDLESGQAVGYEALTRFDDGTAPETVFAEASACGLSMELEIATARSALLAASPLPANRFININVSPRLILAREPLRSMLREWGFGVILEITEHDKVDDYDAIRLAMTEIGDRVQLAVDDAGSGFASLRHILELRPAMVKLDRSLIAGIDTDPARQALVAGMVHFAGRLQFDLLAEGVETEAERATLLALGVSRAQGYLFGRPSPAADLVQART
jgi:EAL domain-containing protein (putative c-di-GMP-specific phosphodiesterase class I)